MTSLPVLGCPGQTGIGGLSGSEEQGPWECGWHRCANHCILNLSCAQPQTVRVEEGVGEGKAVGLAQQDPPAALGGGGWSSGMHILCGGVWLSAILAGAGRPEEWPLPGAGPALMTS